MVKYGDGSPNMHRRELVFLRAIEAGGHVVHRAMQPVR